MNVAKRVILFFKILLWKSNRDYLFDKVSVLSFTTIFCLVPFLASMAIFGAQFFDEYRKKLLEIFKIILPYSEEKIINYLDIFIEQAQSLSKTAIFIFITSSLFLFIAIDNMINEIWEVKHRTNIKAKLASFTMLFFWGPIIMGLGFSILYYFKNHPTTHIYFENQLINIFLSFLITLGGLTMLYWQVPMTQVKAANAFYGALVATSLIELIRIGFTTTLATMGEFSRILYGSFAIAIFFLVAIYLLWMAIIIGCEISFIFQRINVLTKFVPHRKETLAPIVGVVTCIILAKRSLEGNPVVSEEELSEILGTPFPELRRDLSPLIEDNTLKEIENANLVSYLLAKPPNILTVENILRSYFSSGIMFFEKVFETEKDSLERVKKIIKVKINPTLSNTLLEIISNTNKNHL